MRLPLLCAAALLALPVASATAQPRRLHAAAHTVPLRAVHRHARFAAPARAPYGYGYGYTAGTGPVDPRYGYEEAPYDPTYNGPGAEVFAATKAAQRDSGLLHEIAPDAKISASGIVVGGIN